MAFELLAVEARRLLPEVGATTIGTAAFLVGAGHAFNLAVGSDPGCCDTFVLPRHSIGTGLSSAISAGCMPPWARAWAHARAWASVRGRPAARQSRLLPCLIDLDSVLISPSVFAGSVSRTVSELDSGGDSELACFSGVASSIEAGP